MYYTMYVRQCYVRVDSGEAARKVNGNREEVYAQTVGGSLSLTLSLNDVVISPATDNTSTLCQCVILPSQ